jgi:ABC-type bacteriocin/lantibiotic exporter with double-glycine peptidase domain
LAFVVDVVLGEGRYELLAPLMMLSLLIPLLDGVLGALEGYTLALLGDRITLDIRMALYRHVQRLSCRVLHTTPTGKIMERLRGDVGQIRNVLGGQLLGVIMQLLSAPVALVIMLLLSVKLTVMILLAIGLYVPMYKWFVRRMLRLQRLHRSKMDGLSSQVLERLGAAIVVKACGNERMEVRSFTFRSFLTERVCYHLGLLNASFWWSSSFVVQGARLAVLLVGSYLVVRGDLTYGAVMAVGAYTGRLLAPVTQSAQFLKQVQQAKISLRRISELMEGEPDAVDLAGARPESVQGDVVLENVCFHYEPGKPVLEDVSLHARPGQTIALIGHTGAGKSTIANLLYRFHEPQKGRISVDGHDIRALNTR